MLDRVAEHGEMDLVADLARPVPATLICELLGAHLARLEAEIAIGSLVQRFDQLELVDETTEWGRSLFRGFLTAEWLWVICEDGPLSTTGTAR